MTTGMTETRNQALGRVKAMVVGALAGYDAKIYLFGSCAAGTARRSSDIDIAVDTREPLPPNLLVTVVERLEESTIPFEVDVVDLRTVSPDFRAKVLREGVLWSD